MSVRLRCFLAGTLVLFSAVCCWAAFERSLIPAEVHGVVRDKAVQSGTSARVYYVNVDGRRISVDRRIAEKLDLGDRISKGAWESRIVVDGNTLNLVPGPEIAQFAILAVLGAGAVFWLTGTDATSDRSDRGVLLSKPLEGRDN